MKPDDRDRNFWNDLEKRPASRWEDEAQSLAERLSTYNEQQARDALRARVRIVGWIFVIAFVFLFVVVANWLTQ